MTTFSTSPTRTTFAVTHNADAMAEYLDAKARRQLPFATANGLNRTQDEIHRHAKQRLPSQFLFRTAQSRRFFETLYHIGREDRATKTNLRARVGIQEPPGSSWRGKANMLAKFYQAGERVARAGGSPLLYPADFLRPQAASVIPRALYPANLGLAPYRQVKGGKKTYGAKVRDRGEGRYTVRLQGKRRTFAIDPRFHPEAKAFGVWQRDGRGKRAETNRLWLYVARTRWPKRLTFMEDATRMAKERTGLNIAGQLQYAQNEMKQYRARLYEKVARGRGQL